MWVQRDMCPTLENPTEPGTNEDSGGPESTAHSTEDSVTSQSEADTTTGHIPP